ncbi:hypothetical protein SDC9_117572 [bioreactor metagenome]|uniref:Beta-barrel assembly-enhancing protease n=1 Tax=bioreactor metagenome TaxID=1076179 RepID=A0A645BZW6_9ZZZZ
MAAPLARILWLRGDYAAAKKLLTRPDAGAPEQLEYAWMLAAAPEPEERDPRKARLLASRLAVALPYPNVFSVLAQSYAAESDWRGAAQAMSEAEKLLDDQPAERYDRDYYRAFLAMQRRFYRDRRQDAAPELAGRQLFLIEYR